MEYTVTYDEKVNGFTSFHSFNPDWMFGLNNRFLSIKDGQVWLHNDPSVPRNNFYGVQYTSKVKTVFNNNPEDDKIFKTLVQNSNSPWSAKIKTNYTESTITAEEFNQRESRFFSHIRKNEDDTDLHGHSAQGIGSIISSTGLTITFGNVSSTTSIGDRLFQVNGVNNELIGTITGISGNVITVDAITTLPVNGFFSFSKKNSRIEGSEIRGYFMEVELENSDVEDVELFALETNAVKSYV